MATVSNSWLWQALHDGQADLARSLAPSDFSWNSLHPVHGTPLMAVIHNTLANADEAKEAAMHQLIRWIMARGGDPRETAMQAEGMSLGWPPKPPARHWIRYQDTESDDNWWYYDGPLGQFWLQDESSEAEIKTYGNWQPSYPDIKAECHSGHSAISLVLAIRRKLAVRDQNHNGFIQRVDRLIKVFTEAASMFESSTAVVVNTHTADLWAAVLEDEAHADVELTIDGGGAVKAHGLVLTKASPVLRSMLTGAMKEAQSKVISVSGVSVEGLRFLLSLIYTGGWEADEPPITVHLEVIDLAHRWQLNHIVEGLEATVQKILPLHLSSSTGPSRIMIMDKVLETAVLKDLSKLLTSSLALVSKEPDFFIEALKAGGFCDIATRQLRQLAGFGEAPVEERRRVRRRVI